MARMLTLHPTQDLRLTHNSLAHVQSINRSFGIEIEEDRSPRGGFKGLAIPDFLYRASNNYIPINRQQNQPTLVLYAPNLYLKVDVSMP